MNLDALLARLESGESLEIEFKSAAAGLPKNMWTTISAFANTAGGWILLGVAEAGDNLKVQGVKNAAAMIQDIANTLRNKEKISRDVCGPADVKIETVDNVQLIVIRVRAASSREKPVYLNKNPYEGTYVRRNEGDYHCSKQEVDRMIRDAAAESADSAILPGYTWADIDKETFAGYRRQYQTLNPASPKINYDDDRFMRAFGGYRKEAETGQEGFTRAAILMFGTEEALHNLRPRHIIDFRLAATPAEPEKRWEDRLVCEGNLFQAFQQIYPRLTSPLKTPFQLEGPYRLTQTAAHEALREALVNMLAHADYAEQAALLVTASPQEFMFRNPGSSRIPEEDLLTGDRSDPRNPVLLRMFRQISLADEAGTGVPKILRIWREAGLLLPAVASDTERYEFSLTLKLVHLLSKQDREWLSLCAKSPANAQQLALIESLPALTPNEQLALIQARNAGSITNAAIQALTGLHRADVTLLLVGLKERDLLDRESSGRWASYKLPIRLIEAYHHISIKKNDKEQEKPIKKTLKEGLIARIIESCAMAKSANELASELDMNRLYLVTQYLTPLIKTERLAYTNPAHPKARNQKYVATNK
jgi:ATP-dependent DNA helicase RecG